MSEQVWHARHVHHRRELRARRYVLSHTFTDAIGRSPAREQAHDPASWFPLVAITGSSGRDERHGSVRPRSTRPSVIVRSSPAREEAHDPSSWFPIAELERLLDAGGDPSGRTRRPAPSTLTAVVSQPAPASARPAVAEPTRAEIQRARRIRRLRRRLQLTVAGLGLGAGLLLARAHVTADSPEVTGEPVTESPVPAATGDAGTPEGGTPNGGTPDEATVAGAESGEAPVAEAIEPTGLGAIPVSEVIPPPEPPPPPSPPPPPPLPNEEIWDRMAQCETGGNWQHHGPTWSGGLGIYRGAWEEANGTEFAQLPRDATREQQIIVAERIREMHGWTAWGCASTIGVG